jgi:lipopolysaccharide transport system ATP-binding protein
MSPTPRVIQRGQVASVLDINEPADIELEVEVLQPAENLVTGASLYDDTGMCLTASGDWRPNRLPPGRYRKSARIPGPLLAEGRVNILVQAVFYDPSIQNVVVRDALTVDAVDSDDDRSVHGHYKGLWPGALRVHLQWTDAERVGPAVRAPASSRGASS